MAGGVRGGWGCRDERESWGLVSSTLQALSVGCQSINSRAARGPNPLGGWSRKELLQTS